MVTAASIHTHFKKVDPILFPLFRTYPIEIVRPKEPEEYFESLCREIIGQQLSGRVAEVIFKRFVQLFPKKRIVPQTVHAFSEDHLRGIGMSWSKARYIKEIARVVIQKEIDFYSMKHLSDSQVIASLTKIKGIGPWTAEMFLMFTLGREDVFSYGDLGLRRAIQKIYHFKKEPTLSQMQRIANKWKPYRTYAARVLWNSLDNR